MLCFSDEVVQSGAATPGIAEKGVGRIRESPSAVKARVSAQKIKNIHTHTHMNHEVVHSATSGASQYGVTRMRPWSDPALVCSQVTDLILNKHCEPCLGLYVLIIAPAPVDTTKKQTCHAVSAR